MRILVAEDDRRLAMSLRRGLDEQGFGTDIVHDGDAAVDAALATPFDVLILDVMMPKRDGLEVCRNLRARHVRTPILLLTARDAIPDRVQGLDAGADDYLVKPFAFDELLARLRALGRRHLDNRAAMLEVNGIRLDTAARKVFVNGGPVDLRTKELAVLEYFMHNPGRLLTRTQVEEHVWSYGFAGESNIVESYIARLRRKLIAAGAQEPFTTVRGSGYRFEV